MLCWPWGIRITEQLYLGLLGRPYVLNYAILNDLVLCTTSSPKPFRASCHSLSLYTFSKTWELLSAGRAQIYVTGPLKHSSTVEALLALLLTVEGKLLCTPVCTKCTPRK